MKPASELPIGDFIAIRGMQIMRGRLGFLPATIPTVRAAHRTGGTLGDFVKRLKAAGGTIDAQELAKCCAKAEEELLQLNKDGLKAITFVDDAYPATLTPDSDQPAILYYRGDISLLKRSSVAVVGAREVAEADKTIAKRIAMQLSAQGFVVTSGLAVGCDSWAHYGAIEARGKTIGVLQAGYSPRHQWSATPMTKSILEAGGLIVSPFPSSTVISRDSLLYRNRVTVGQAVGTVLVKADRISGTMSAVMKALEMGRPLAVVAQEGWGVPDAQPAPGYQGGFDLLKTPRGALPPELSKYAAVQKAKSVSPQMPFAIGLWGAPDLPRLFSTMEGSAANFEGIVHVKPQQRRQTEAYFTGGLVEYEEKDPPAAGPGRNMHRRGRGMAPVSDADVLSDADFGLSDGQATTEVPRRPDTPGTRRRGSGGMGMGM